MPAPVPSPQPHLFGGTEPSRQFPNGKYDVFELDSIDLLRLQGAIEVIEPELFLEHLAKSK